MIRRNHKTGEVSLGAITIKMHSKLGALEGLARHLGMFKENVQVDVNVSLADLVNGSFRLERGEAQAMLESPAPLELEAEEVTGEARPFTGRSSSD